MDLVRIFHVVDRPSSGKHAFNHIYAVGLIVSILIQFYLIQFILILFLSGVHPMFMFFFVFFLYGYCSKNVGLCHPFLTVYFPSVFSDTRCCSVFSGFVWFPILCLAFTDDHGVD